MTVYWTIAAVAFTTLWLAMVWRVCIDASECGAPGLALSFIPLFTMGVAMVAIMWPLGLTVLCVFILTRLPRYDEHGQRA